MCFVLGRDISPKCERFLDILYIRLGSNKRTLLIQHDIIFGNDIVFPVVKLSELVSHEHGTKSLQ